MQKVGEPGKFSVRVQGGNVWIVGPTGIHYAKMCGGKIRLEKKRWALLIAMCLTECANQHPEVLKMMKGEE